MTATDPARIAAEGVTIPTALGELRLVYGMRALRQLEDTFGSVLGLQEAMQQVWDDLKNSEGKAKAFGPVIDLLVPGMLVNGLTEDEAVDALQPQHLKVYAEAMGAAMEEAFPSAEPAPAGRGNEPRKAPGRTGAKASRGRSGTTSPPAATGAQTPSSGA